LERFLDYQVALTGTSVCHAGEERQALFFIDMDSYRRPNGFLDHEVCRNPSYTNVSLHPRLHHPPSRMKAVLVAWVYRPRVLRDGEILHDELDHFQGQWAQPEEDAVCP
jgi:hypothetical protein